VSALCTKATGLVPIAELPLPNFRSSQILKEKMNSSAVIVIEKALPKEVGVEVEVSVVRERCLREIGNVVNVILQSQNFLLNQIQKEPTT
jgi:hypothetical protein|tara:strand:- start:941 stop:1210 length:270 start_codon:yes stop_codon:yes gene_type:complete